MTSKAHAPAILVDDAIATIPASNTTSGAVNLNGTSIVGAFIPAGFQGTSISFQASPDDVTYYDVKDGFGGTVSRTVAAGEYIYIDPSQFVGIQHLKIISNATESAERQIILASRPI